MSSFVFVVNDNTFRLQTILLQNTLPPVLTRVQNERKIQIGVLSKLVRNEYPSGYRTGQHRHTFRHDFSQGAPYQVKVAEETGKATLGTTVDKICFDFKCISS